MTKIAAYVDALVAALDVALTAPVFDGAPHTDEPLSDYVVIGWSALDADAGEIASVAATATAEREWVTAELGQASELFDVIGCCVSQSGDSSLPAARTAAAGLLGQVTAVVNPLSVPGVHWARLRTTRLVQSVTTEGAMAGFDFVVQVSADV